MKIYTDVCMKYKYKMYIKYIHTVCTYTHSVGIYNYKISRMYIYFDLYLP